MQTVNIAGYTLVVSKEYVSLNDENTSTFLVTRNITSILRVRISHPKYIIAGFIFALFFLWIVKLQSGRRLNNDETTFAWLVFLLPLIIGLIAYLITQKSILQIRSANGMISLEGHIPIETIKYLTTIVGNAMFQEPMASSYDTEDST